MRILVKSFVYSCLETFLLIPLWSRLRLLVFSEGTLQRDLLKREVEDIRLIEIEKLQSNYKREGKRRGQNYGVAFWVHKLRKFIRRLTIIFLMNQQMHCQTASSGFRMVKMKNCVNRGFIKSPLMLKMKQKPISKRKEMCCSKRCQLHQFSLRRINGRETPSFKEEISEVSYNFCPMFNDIKSHTQGGAPFFRKDSRIDTPTFSPQFQAFTATDDEIFRERYQRMIDRAAQLNIEPNISSISDSNDQQTTQKSQISPLQLNIHIQKLQQMFKMH